MIIGSERERLAKRTLRAGARDVVSDIGFQTLAIPPFYTGFTRHWGEIILRTSMLESLFSFQAWLSVRLCVVSHDLERDLNGECINMLALRIISTKLWCREVSRSDAFRYVSDPMNLHPRPRGATYPTCSWDLVGARFFALSMRFGEVSLCLCVFVCEIHIMAKRNRPFPPFPGRGQGN